MKWRWKLPNKIKIVLGITALLLFTCLCFTAAFFLTIFFYKQIGHQPNQYLEQLINVMLTFLIFGLIMNIIARFLSPKRLAFVKSLTDAIRKMAQGDFDVHLDVGNKHDNPFNELVESINHMASELGQMEQMRQEFISNVSHELQSPLTSIGGFAGVLQNDELTSEERIHYLQIIEMESTRLSKLSENLLKLTSLESEHHPFEPKSYSLDRQIRNIILSCEPQWVEKDIEMDISLPATEIVADEDLMSQVWVNLLHNSMKFSPQGGHIKIELFKTEKETIVCISDIGSGISPADLAHIFERFYKADKSRNRSLGGSGLGLSIVKKIIDMHHGKIQVESELGQGTTFIVHLQYDFRNERR